MRWMIAVLAGLAVGGVSFADGGAGAGDGNGQVVAECVSGGVLGKDRKDVGMGEDVWLTVDRVQAAGKGAAAVEWSIEGPGQLMAYTGRRTLYRAWAIGKVTITAKARGGGGGESVVGRVVINGGGGGGAVGKVEGEDFAKDLGALVMLEQGTGTDMQRVRAVGAELLKRYGEREERGRIYEEMACAEAGAGFPDPAETIAAAKQAAELAPAPEQRVQAWMCRADAELIARDGGDGAAEEALLGAMNVVLGEEVPELLPELPGVSMYEAGGNVQAQAAAEMAHAREMEARKRAERARMLWLEREVVMDHLMELAGADGGAGLEKAGARVLDTAQKRERFEGLVELWEKRKGR